MIDPPAKATSTQEERQTTVRTRAVPVALTALSVRLFGYGGQQGKLRDLTWQPESALTALLRTLVQDGQGNVTQIGTTSCWRTLKIPCMRWRQRGPCSKSC